MNFYQVMTDVGPQFVRTQAEAKAIDPAYTKVDVPVDQTALMERLNNLMAAVHGKQPADAAPEPADDDYEPVAPPPPPKPKAPSTKPAMVERSYDQIGFEEFVYAVPATEAYRLNVLQACIDTRRAEIEKVKS